MPTIALALALALMPQTVDAEIAALSRDHVNVALKTWGYSRATASSRYQGDYGPENAIDGRWAVRESDKWNAAEGKAPHWLVVDLGHTYRLDAVVIRHEGVLSDGSIYNTSDFAIQRASKPEGPWVDMARVRGNKDHLSLVRFPAAGCRYLRLNVEKGEQRGNAFARIFELEAYAPKASIDVPLVRLDWPQIPAYRSRGNRLESAVEVRSATEGPIGAFEIGGKPATAENGLLWLPVVGDKPVKVSRKSAGGPTASWSMADSRAWLTRLQGGAIHIVSSSHQDVAWMDTPDACRDYRVNEVLVPAIEMMERNPRYRFTMENMLNLVELLEARPELRGQIEKFIREGRLEFGGTYNQPYEGLLGGEQLIRQTYFGRRLLRKEFPGADTCVAYSVDVPGRSLQMQQILAKSGIRYMVVSRYHEGLFRWLGPDGSEILLYSMPHYGDHNAVLQAEPSVGAAAIPGAIRAAAASFAKRQIPPEFLLLSSGDFQSPANFDNLIKAWDQTPVAGLLDGKPVPKPTLDYSSTAEFLKALDKPTAKPMRLMGERPDLWLYIHGPTHHAAIEALREGARLLPAAETFATVLALVENDMASYPQKELAAGWLDSLYPDHGWGGWNGHITDGVFHAKLASARDAGRNVLDRSLRALAGHVKTDPAKGRPVVVFNPHSWSRSDAVTMEAPSAAGAWEAVDAQGRIVPCQTDRTPRQENVASAAYGARIVSSTGAKAERLMQDDWWDPRAGWWESPASPDVPAEVVVDLGSVREIGRILVRHYGSLGEYEKETRLNTKAFRVFGRADAGSPWAELVPPTTANVAPLSVFEFKPVAARYLRLEVTGPTQGVDGIARVLGLEAFAAVEPDLPRVTFHAADVPSLGYRTFYLRPATKAVGEQTSGGQIVENDFYRIKLTPGGVASLYDKKAQAEIFRPCGLTPGEVVTLKSEGNGAGEFGAVQQPTMEGFDRTSAHRPRWTLLADRSGPVQSVFELVQPMGGATVRQRLTVYHRVKKVDFDVDLEGWRGDKYREFRIAFPIGGPRAKVSYGVPMGTVRVGEDEIKTTGGRAYGSLDYWQQSKDIHPREVLDCIQVRDGRVTTTVSNCVSVFDYVDPTGMGGRGPLIQPILLASRRSCHGNGNWYLQPGDHRYHFSITSSTDARSGWRHGADAQAPLPAVVADSAAGSLPPTLSFASLNVPGVRISTIKKAEDDDSVVVRCYDVEGRPTTALLRFFVPFGSARACNLIEDEGDALPVNGEGVRIGVGKFSIETVKLRR